MLGFSPLAGAALASTGASSQSVTVSISSVGGIVRSENNLSTPMLRGAVGFLPEETLFEVVVNGRILGDTDNSGSFNVNDVSNALQWEAGTSSAAVTAYIEGPMTAYMKANLAAYEGINIAFSSVSMSGVVGTGVIVETNKNVATLNNRLQIAQVSDNLAPAISKAVGNQPPNVTLFNTLVNGRKLGDINDNGSLSGQDTFIAQKWDFDNASLSLNDSLYISGPMNDYMIANFSSFGPAGIGLIFNSPTGVGAVDDVTVVESAGVSVSLDNINITATGVVEVDGVDVETDQVIDVDNVGITATGVVGTDTTVETDQVIDVDNLGITATGVVDVDGVTVVVGTGVTVSLDNEDITATGIVEEVLVWSAIIPDQTANFILISPSQTSGFGPVSPSQTSSFTSVIPSQTSGFTPVVPSQSSTWVEIVL